MITFTATIFTQFVMPPSILPKRHSQANIRDTDWMDNNGQHNEMIQKQTFILQFLVNDFYRSSGN